MNRGGLGKAPPGLRWLTTLALFGATVAALANLPGDQLPLPWLLAFTLPGAVLGRWSRLSRSPLSRALLASALQAGACWGALEWAGPMNRPAALACTILPPMAFATVRNHDADPALPLFLSFCVLLVGIILDGLHLPLVLGYGVTAFLALHGSTLAQSYRVSAAKTERPAVLAADVSATSLLGMSFLLAVFALDRTLSCVPSLSEGRDAAGERGAAQQQIEVGLDDTFSFDGPGGVLSELRGEQLVRVESFIGLAPRDLYLRCGFFTAPGLDRWDIGPLDLGPQSAPREHLFRPEQRGQEIRSLLIERYAGAAKFVFLPPHTTRVRGITDLVVDQQREWIRPRRPSALPYEVIWQPSLQPAPGARIRPDRTATSVELLALPAELERGPFEALLERWDVSGDPAQAMAAIAAGLEQRCRYDRSTPTGPFAHELQNFLFSDEDRHGYCMHFASAAALMLRMRGVPCRIAVGLYGGEATQRADGARIYGSQHAHAWVEVPTAEQGYMVFDPTPPGVRGRGFVPDQREALAAGGDVAAGRSFLEPAIRRVSDLVAQPWTWAAALVATLLLAALPRRAPRPKPERRATAQPRARRKLQRLLRALAQAGHPRGHAQTLEHFAQELGARLEPDVRDAFAAYQEVRFGGRSFDEVRARAMDAGIRAAAAMQPAPAAGLGER